MTMPDTSQKIKRDPERTRQRILAAATEEFAERGLSGARVDSIARRADINERMLYYYYGNKDQLYTAVLEDVYLAFNRAEHALNLDALAPLAAVSALAHFIWDYYAAHPELIRLINNENLHEARHMHESPQIRALVSPIVDMLASILKRGEASGEIRSDVDPVHLYVTISALGYYLMSNRHTLATVMGRDLMAPDARSAYTAFNTQVLLDYLRVK
ncbi:TetR family transcriptional regulator [Pandoraea terrae]|uniref:TetR family transcriptional regulator n=1 Tax=Pandoraea terrae TaxID=1537710 RepID=A0A5E4VQI9_9BURK|nr:TetR/AcrR family transcriptional regulator [Pandoraea terrae]VVE13789.1 TetR family transcriptional regulator [Pandoraea terrae]